MGDSEKLLSCLGKLGVKLKLGDFSERKRIQKIVCLLQLFGIELGFGFSWYIHGPYSPDLTRTLFELKNSTRKSVSFTRKEDEIITRFREFVGESLESSDAMELMGSLFFLRRMGKKVGVPDTQILEIFKQKKPLFSDEAVQAVWIRLEDIEKKQRMTKKAN